MREPVKRRRHFYYGDEDTTRDTPAIATPVRSFVPARTVLQMLEDRREFYPSVVRPPKGFFKAATRLVVPHAKQSRFSWPTAAVGFAVPRKVAICVRRKQRREVLFASGVGGSRRRQRKPRYSYYSAVEC